MSKPSIPKGTRDFSPTEMVRRNYIFSTIRKSFQRYGFMPIETPAMENLSTLTGKYGDEGDKLIFKILNSGDAFKELRENYPDEKLSTFNFPLSTICEKALRYDLTVPFARYVVQHQNDISFPFKRYQIQPVWRADRPQKGRYREFYQCDADVVGSDSLLYEVELIQLFDEVLTNLGIPDFTIKINNRKILQGIAEYCGCTDKLVDITVAIDKFDKIGKEGVIEELKSKGISEDKVELIFDCIFPEEEDYVFYSREQLLEFGFTEQEIEEELKIQDSKYRKDLGIINCLDDSFRNPDEVSKTGIKGVRELKYLFEKINDLGLKSAKLEFDPTLARGLNYYTGAIFEVKANGVSIGSICGGGRYDDLTGIFGLKNVSGVGISFGADRIYDVLNELNLFPEFTSETTQVLFTNFGENEVNYCLPLLKELREKGINAEIYPSDAKLKKQLSYADSKQIKFVVLVGSEEFQNNQITLKNMQSGEQITISKTELFKHITL
jgi:histidyl-tRNA synthetase